MPADQKEIHYVTAPTRRSAEEGPHLEALKRRGYDVLLLTDPVDEWVVQSLTEFDKRRLKSAAHGEADVGDEKDESRETAERAAEAALFSVKRFLGDRVKDVRFSRRLTDSASCLVAAEGDPSANLQRIMKMLDAGAEEAPRILELNPSHPIIQNLSALAAREPEGARVREWSELLYDQALLAEGVVKEPAALVKRIQSLFAEVTAAAVTSSGSRGEG
jgi:molecular chaperone HtpG